jgi:hypothetical protein
MTGSEEDSADVMITWIGDGHSDHLRQLVPRMTSLMDLVGIRKGWSGSAVTLVMSVQVLVGNGLQTYDSMVCWSLATTVGQTLTFGFNHIVFAKVNECHNATTPHLMVSYHLIDIVELYLNRRSQRCCRRKFPLATESKICTI